MALLKRNRLGDIGGYLKERATEVSGKDGGAVTQRDLTEYFLKVGLDTKGDFQSYRFARGSEKGLTFEVDLVALAAACAGVPVPETPLFATVGSKVTLTNTHNKLVGAFVCPENIRIANRHLCTRGCGQIMLLAMNGYHWESAVDFSAEVGVQACVPRLPSLGTSGGDYGGNDDKPLEVESGTYAELAAFDMNISAKASTHGHAGVSGERLYLSDTVPTYIHRIGCMQEIEKHLGVILRFGDKKASLKSDVKAFLHEQHHAQVRTIFQRLITGGDVSSSRLIKALHEVQDETTDDSLKEMCQHHIRSIEDYKAHDVLAPYNFISLWGMKPQAGAGIGVQAEASLMAKAGGVAQAGASAVVELKGPSIEANLKFTRFRFQAAGLAREESHHHHFFAKSNAPASKKMAHTDPGLVNRIPESTPSNAYAIMTQDTSITYGQMDLTLLEASGGVEAGISQSAVKSDRLQRGVSAEKEASRGIAIASASAEANLGVEETSVKAEASAGLKKALNFMQYESAVAFWAPPEDPGDTANQTVPVMLAEGSGFSYGQSVDIVQFNRYLNQVLSNPGQKCGYMQKLAAHLCVSYDELKQFLVEHGKSGLIGDMAHLAQLDPKEQEKYKDHLPSPSAFLIESSFSLLNLKSVRVEAVWSTKSRWVLGPKKKAKSLRGVFIGKDQNPRHKGSLQAIRLRYRIADDKKEKKGRFSLGVKYIASLGIEYASVEEAGSEGIVNLGTTWYGELARWNQVDHGSHGGSTPEQKAREKAVPQVVLLHQ